MILSKKKILGVKHLGIIDAGCDTTPRSAMLPRSGGMDDVWHNIAAFNRWNDERNVNVNRNDNDWNDSWWFAGSRNSLHFPAPSFGLEGAGFCFRSWPFQPPSILPTSSTFKERAMYFLLSKDLVSQRTIKSIFNASSFRMASRTRGCFSGLGRKPARETASITSTNKTSILWPREYLCIFGIVWQYWTQTIYAAFSFSKTGKILAGGGVK